MNKFFVFEGVDGSGKDTQLDKSFMHLKKIDKYAQIFITREPTLHTEYGRRIIETLNAGIEIPGPELLSLIVKDRTAQTDTRKSILQHSHILSSRSDLSTYGYQGTQGLSFDQIYKAHDYTKILLPDVTFLIDVDIDNIENRIAGRGEKRQYFEKVELLKKVRENLLYAYEKLQNERNIKLINGDQTIEEVFRIIGAEIETQIK